MTKWSKCNLFPDLHQAPLVFYSWSWSTENYVNPESITRSNCHELRSSWQSDLVIDPGLHRLNDIKFPLGKLALKFRGSCSWVVIDWTVSLRSKTLASFSTTVEIRSFSFPELTLGGQSCCCGFPKLPCILIYEFSLPTWRWPDHIATLTASFPFWENWVITVAHKPCGDIWSRSPKAAIPNSFHAKIM